MAGHRIHDCGDKPHRHFQTTYFSFGFKQVGKIIPGCAIEFSHDVDVIVSERLMHTGGFDRMVGKCGYKAFLTVDWNTFKPKIISGDDFRDFRLFKINVCVGNNFTVTRGKFTAFITHTLAHSRPLVGGVDKLNLAPATWFFIFIQNPNVGSNARAVEH